MSDQPSSPNHSPNTHDNYENIGDAYIALVDRKPYNALYERPAVLSMLPPLAGLDILDAGCGSGWYGETYLEQGAASVTSFDVSAKMAAAATARLGDRARVLQADLAQPLDFAGDACFDLIVAPLVLHYLKDWEGPLSEFRRVLRPRGLLVFSTHHPFMDFTLFKQPDYFATSLIEDEWSIGKVYFYRRPLTAISAALRSAGFVIEHLLEPQPVEEFQARDPEGYEKLMHNPWFLVIRARRDD